MVNEYPFVSIIVPCRNEEKYIGKCLYTILEQDYPKENLEVLVVDGMSEDKSRDIIKTYSEKLPFIKILDNPRKFTNFAFNIGVKEAKGQIIILMGAHAGYEKDYISKCVSHLIESGAENVGGAIKTLPAKNTLEARAIAYSLSSPFGAASDFRVGSKTAKSVDTVFGGCYKKEIFQKAGLFNEKLRRSQDFEFNLRLKKAGGRILLFPDIIISYYPQATFGSFFKHNLGDGTWSIYPLKIIKVRFKLRHYLPLIFVSTIIVVGILSVFSCLASAIFIFIIFYYFLAAFYFSFRIAVREKDFRFFFLMPLAFACRHFGYGLGSIFGIIKIFIS